MTSIETLDGIITRCPIAGGAIKCPVLVRDLELARESSGEVFIGNEARDRDNSIVRVIRLMQGAQICRE